MNIDETIFWQDGRFRDTKRFHIQNDLWFIGDGIYVTIMQLDRFLEKNGGEPTGVCNLSIKWEATITRDVFASVIASMSDNVYTLELYNKILSLLSENKSLPSHSVEKPDLDSIYKKYFLQAHDGLHDYWEKESAEKILNELVLPLSVQNSKLVADLNLKDSVNEFLKIERNTLRKENEELKADRNEMRQIIHDQNGKCQEKLSEQLNEILPELSQLKKDKQELVSVLKRIWHLRQLITYAEPVSDHHINEAEALALVMSKIESLLSSVNKEEK